MAETCQKNIHIIRSEIMKIETFKESILAGDNPNALCDECNKNTPIKTIKIGHHKHLSAHFHLCEACYNKLKGEL